MNKKALSVAKIVSAAILMACLVLFLYYMFSVRMGASQIVEDSECYSSVVSHVTMLKATGNSAVSDIYCPTRYYTLKTNNDERIKYQMAEALKSCWGSWGKGQLQLFKEDNMYCHICSLIDFKDKDEKVPGLGEYLSTKRITSGSGKGMTYLEYLTPYSSQSKENQQVLKDSVDIGEIDTKKQYAVMFIYARGDNTIEQAINWAGRMTRSEGSVDLGTTGEASKVGFLVGTILVGAAAYSAAIGAGFIACSTVIGCLFVVGTATASGGGLGWWASHNVEWYAANGIVEYDADILKDMGCKVAPAKQDAHEESLG